MAEIETGKLSGLGPEAGELAITLARIRDYDPPKFDDLLPWHWTVGLQAAAKAA